MNDALQQPGTQPLLIRRLAAVMRVVGYVELSIGVLLTFFITAVIAASVFFRYVLSSPLIWSEEAVTISFIWMTLLGAAIAAKMDRHIYITSFGSYLSDVNRIYLNIFVRLFILVIAAMTASFTFEYIGMQNRSNTVSLPVNFPRGWVFGIPTLLALSSIAATEFVLLLDSMVRLRKGGAGRAPIRIMDTFDVAGL